MVGLVSLVCVAARAQSIPGDRFLVAAKPPGNFSALFVSEPDAGVSPSAIPDRDADNDLPDAPLPQDNSQNPAQTNQKQPLAQQEKKSTAPGFPAVSPTPGQLPRARQQHPGIPSQPSPCIAGISTETRNDISCSPKVDSFQRFVDSGVHPLTPRQKFILAYRNTTDPFNFATIALVSGVSVASDPNSPYGPGWPGFGRNFGVAYCETAIGEFFGTFLVPAIAHQDPHYHRMPNASYGRRTLHAITQVVWAQSDYGNPMPNYSNLITTAVGDGLGNLYVPGRSKSWGAGVARYSTAIATDPIDNFITEFLPDVARRINIRIVLVQRVIDRVQLQN